MTIPPKKSTLKKVTIATAAVAGTVAQGSAFIITGANGSQDANADLDTLQKEHEDFKFADNVVKMGSGTGVYIGGDGRVGYLLTAGHLGEGIGSVEVSGVIYSTHSSELVGHGDLRLFTIGGQPGDPSLPDLPPVRIAERGVAKGDDLVLLGRGTRVELTDGDASTSDMSQTSSKAAFRWGEVGEINWAENSVDVAPGWLGGGVTANWSAASCYSQQSVFFTRFDDPGDGNHDTSWEGQAAGGDSGGPAFVKDSRTGEYLLAGITHGVQKRHSQEERTAAFGNRTAYVNLADYADQLPNILEVNSVAESSTALLGLSGSVSLVTGHKRKEDSDKAEIPETR